MMKRWCSPFMIFLLLLIVLLLSVVFSKYLPLEGFIGYNSSASNASHVLVKPYSSTIQLLKIYDSIYYDPTSGNMLELFGSASANSDTSSLTDMIVIPRQGTDIIIYSRKNTTPPDPTFSDNTVESQYLVPIQTSYEAWVYPNMGSVSSHAFNYQIFYFPWKTQAVIVVNDILQTKIVGSFPITSSNSTSLNTGNTTYPRVAASALAHTDEKYVDVLPQYAVPSGLTIPTQLYKIETNIWFDTTNGIVIMMKSGSTDVTMETGVSFTMNVETDTSVMKSVILNDPENQYVIVCTAFPQKRTMVSIICLDEKNTSSSQLLSIYKVILFDPSLPGGIDTTGSINNNNHHHHTKSPTDSPTNHDGKDGKDGKDGNDNKKQDMNQYILKSQIVPPVCPACPSCNNNSCASCQAVTTMAPLIGGSGSNSLSSLIANSYTVGQKQNNTNAGGSGGENWSAATTAMVTGAEGTVGNVLDSAIGGTALLGLGAIGGVTSLGNTVADDITKLGTGVADDVVQLGTGVTGDVAGVANNIVSSIKDIVNNTMDDLTNKGKGSDNTSDAKSSGENEDEEEKKCKAKAKSRHHHTPTPTAAAGVACNAANVPGGYKMATGPGLNNYYGALANRNASNFMPVTSDFSKFGR